jgi:hypothetical protein
MIERRFAPILNECTADPSATHGSGRDDEYVKLRVGSSLHIRLAQDDEFMFLNSAVHLDGFIAAKDSDH